MSSEIPVIDVAKFLSASPEDRADTVQKVRQALEEVGFLMISGHGVPGIADRTGLESIVGVFQPTGGGEGSAGHSGPSQSRLWRHAIPDGGPRQRPDAAQILARRLRLWTHGVRRRSLLSRRRGAGSFRSERLSGFPRRFRAGRTRVLFRNQPPLPHDHAPVRGRARTFGRLFRADADAYREHASAHPLSRARPTSPCPANCVPAPIRTEAYSPFSISTTHPIA